MTTLIVGGAGFVGLNLAEALLAAGRDVILFDRQPPPEAALRAFAPLPGRLEAHVGDVTGQAALDPVIGPGLDAIVLGAAVTPSAEREAREPGSVLRVNLLSLVPILDRARAAGVRRVVNLSSAAAYGHAADRESALSETTAADPFSLYAITKYASERVAERLAGLWELDVVSVRLSAVFGPWERATGMRDTISPQTQILTLAAEGRPAVLDRPGIRDWIYARDVAEALRQILAAERLAHRLYNVSSPESWPVLDWGLRVAAAVPGFVCRLAEPGEDPTVALHAPTDRAPLATDRLRTDLGWSARFGMTGSCDDVLTWWRCHGPHTGALT